MLEGIAGIKHPSSKLLSDGGYTVPCSNGKNKVTYSSRINIAGMNQKIDFIKFRKSKLSSFSENARNMGDILSLPSEIRLSKADIKTRHGSQSREAFSLDAILNLSTA